MSNIAARHRPPGHASSLLSKIQREKSKTNAAFERKTTNLEELHQRNEESRRRQNLAAQESEEAVLSRRLSENLQKQRQQQHHHQQQQRRLDGGGGGAEDAGGAVATALSPLPSSDPPIESEEERIARLRRALGRAAGTVADEVRPVSPAW